MFLSDLLPGLVVVVVAVLSAVWWVRRSRRGIDWVIAALPLAAILSYLSSILFHVPDYQAGCPGGCPGWWGYPIATYISNAVGEAEFDPIGFLLSLGFYYAFLLFVSVLVAWLANFLHWEERRLRWKVGFVLLVVVLPLALAPSYLPPPELRLSGPSQRLAINAARAWRWQLLARRLTDRRLAVEDVRLHPDGERQRVCFRAYTWFFIPSHRVYIDLEPAGVRATAGGSIPLSASCWVQP